MNRSTPLVTCDRYHLNSQITYQASVYIRLKNFTNLYHLLGLAYTTKAKLNASLQEQKSNVGGAAVLESP
jgi:hypothetical protein